MDEREQKRIFDEWLSKHQGLLFKVVRANAFTLHDQDDLFQEIAIQLWKSIPTFRGESAVTTWVYRVAFYCAIDWTRKEKRHRDRKQSINPIEHALTTTPKYDDHRLDWLYRQIAKLNEIDRSLTLLMLDGFSYKEMSAILGISENHIGVKIHRIKKHLSETLKEEPDHEA